MKDIEYGLMAHFYDLLYKNKDYKKETDFIKLFLKEDYSVLDAGAGTGCHAYLLHKSGYNVCGFDKSKSMVNEANKKMEGRFFEGDILTITPIKKYDAVISMFAVFNHLKNYKEFKIGLSNLKEALKPNGVIIIDLHNPQKNGKKIDEQNDIKRVMKWTKNKLTNKEKTIITYNHLGKEYQSKHIFKIFKINKLKKIALALGFKKVNFYEDYNVSRFATRKSKNVQMVISL